MWLNHPRFPLIVEKVWDGNPLLDHAISSFVNAATTWNREVFGNIFVRKKKILARQWYLEGHCIQTLDLPSIP